ncbi:hypothetical protein I203_100872 [Kwoniella mangroviensis CBS 8507]|uniref:uncharacterized protein n=1 Tax=Kwoniella mangroviensis CBS 8507 TaxID=1296122 RepID=UPI00080D44A3|nr:uncharacterized protein I203_02513 [Kwoniella mangroviensis CBS 8507]OCF67857.1 hypothetical protein I203_02513 [Kwoniella mangroviensis CBS 8507]
MRRLSPSTLRQRVLPPISQRVFSVSPTTTRTLKTSTISNFPRSTSSRRTFVASSTDHAPEEPPYEPAGQVHEEEEIPDEPSIPPSDTEDLFQHTTSVINPSKPSSALPMELGPALTHLSTAFLSGNQHLAEDIRLSQPFTHVVSFPDSSGRPRTESAEPTQELDESAPEAVLALASPFEGGEAYVTDAVKRLANELNADIVRFDLVTGLGLDGPSSPLGSRGIEPPSLPQSLNPLYLPAPQPLVTAKKETIEPEDQDDQGGMPGMFASVPIAVVGGGGGMMPSGLGGLPGMGGMEEDLPQGQINDEWVHFFSKIINAGQSQPGKKRIIALESTIAMSKTFPIWWASFVEAVKQRRKGLITPSKSSRKGQTAHIEEPSLAYPTSIVLQCTPSLTLPHTAAAFASAARDEDGSLREEDEHHEEMEEEEADSNMDPAQAALAAIEEKFKSMGISVHSHVEVVKPRNDAKLWWGSEESDVNGRKEGDKGRLSLMLAKGIPAILPSFGSKATENGQKPTNPLRRFLRNRFGAPPNQPANSPNSLVWKAYPVIPQHRNFQAEKEARVHQRRVWTAALIQRAIHQLGGVLNNPLDVLSTSEITGRPLTRKTESSGAGKGWGNMVISWNDAMHIASIALGTAIRSGNVERGAVKITWQNIIQARKAMGEEKKIATEQIKRHLPSGAVKIDSQMKTEIENAPQSVVDPVVEQIKKTKSLSQHEKRLLPCIVDPTKLASTSFKDVHLPEKTVDGIRSMVSLPLLFPEAFRGGVLKDHATTGALLFGPPGTGKTLLARAVAAESGARMLAIQPSDVNDMYVGEGEKLVKAVFNLARRLSPCVVFLDEVDALFGARISRGSAGSMSHNLLLTEFMQEMDGLSSAIANKDKRVVVIGATNRPFDLDDAVLRRLPRRLLVDLPSVEGRQAILEILLRGETLADDVDLQKLAKETDGFSGSDLKHLCVSAALAAVKDTVQVPWSKKSATDSNASTPSPAQTSAGTGGGAQAEVLVFAPSEGGGGGRKKAQVKREKTAAPIAGPSRLVLDTTASVQPIPEDAEKGLSSVEGEGEGDQQIAQGDIDELLSANQAGYEPSSDESIIPEEGEGESSESDLPEPVARVLGWKHFKIALEEIRPSSSEEGSLPELRKWSEQFGEGGTRKGKKSGFGRGFGFGDEKSGDRESGYGKVKQDD